MQKERPNKQNNLHQAAKEGYIIVPNYFLREWVSILGVGPALLYLQLLSYCHKEKDIAWPTLTTLSSKLGISKNSLLSYRKTLLKYGLIKKIVKRRAAQGNYQSNFYKITPIEGGANIELRHVQILGGGSANIAPGVVQNLHPNNTNLNITNLTTTTKREKDAVAAVVNFKKLKEKGEENMQAPFSSKEHYTGQAIRERMVELDFKEGFVEKMLKKYSLKKIEEKLDLLMERKNIQNPPGWLNAALQNDYLGEEQESRPTPHPLRGKTVSSIEYRVYSEEKTKREMDSRVRNDIDTPEWTSTEKAIKAIKLIQNNLSARISPIPSEEKEGDLCPYF